MPVSAISSVFTKSNNVNFTSLRSNKDKYGNDYDKSSSFMKAVPLAAVLAMSPLTTANIHAADRIDNPAHNIELAEARGVDATEQTRKIISTKEFPSRAENYESVKVRLVNNTGGAGFDKIELIFRDRNGLEYDDGDLSNYVTEIATYNFAIISDDGVNQGTMPLNIVYSKTPTLSSISPAAYAHDDVVNYIKEQLAKNPKKNVIPVNTYNRKLSPTLGGGLQNNPKKITINNAQGITVDPNSYTLADRKQVVGENDKYSLRIYKNKNGGANLVTCEKASNPGKLFRVALVGDFSANIEKNADSPSIATYPLTILRNNNDGFGLMDSVLANELKKIKATPLGSNAFITPAMDYEYALFGKGVLANVTD